MTDYHKHDTHSRRFAVLITEDGFEDVTVAVQRYWCARCQGALARAALLALWGSISVFRNGCPQKSFGQRVGNFTYEDVIGQSMRVVCAMFEHPFTETRAHGTTRRSLQIWNAQRLRQALSPTGPTLDHDLQSAA